MRKLAFAAAAAAVVGLLAGTAGATHNANHLPANATFYVGDVLEVKQVGPGMQTTTIMGPVKYKVSTSGDLTFSFHTECLLFTQTKSKGGAQNTASARLDVWIELKDSDGTTVVVTVSPEDDGTHNITQFVLDGVDFGNDPGAGRVTMCGRIQSLKNDDPDNFVNLWLVTRQSHGFVWAIADPATITDFDNVFDVRVKAKLTNTEDADTTARLAVAKRSLLIEEHKAFVGAQCQDGVDNDGDGDIDLADAECETATDTLESE